MIFMCSLFSCIAGDFFVSLPGCLPRMTKIHSEMIKIKKKSSCFKILSETISPQESLSSQHILKAGVDFSDCTARRKVLQDRSSYLLPPVFALGMG